MMGCECNFILFFFVFHLNQKRSPQTPLRLVDRDPQYLGASQGTPILMEHQQWLLHAPEVTVGESIAISWKERPWYNLWVEWHGISCRAFGRGGRKNIFTSNMPARKGRRIWDANRGSRQFLSRVWYRRTENPLCNVHQKSRHPSARA